MMILIIFLIIFLLAVAILLFPVTISVNSTRSVGKIKGNIQLFWIIAGLIYVFKERELEIRILNRRIIRHISIEEKPHEPIKKPKKLKRHWKMPPIKDFLNLTGPLLQLFKELVYAFRLKYIDLDITFGLNDPAQTGILTGFLHALGSSQMGNVRWTPDFTRQVMDWDLKAETSFIPIRLLLPFARFITRGQVLSSLRGIIG